MNEADKEVFIIQLTLIDSQNSDLVTMSQNVTLGIIIDDDRKFKMSIHLLVYMLIILLLLLAMRIGFEKQIYNFTEPPASLSKLFHIPLVKEGGRISEQTFTLQIKVSNMTTPYQPATLGDDYKHQLFNITFHPDQQTVFWEFELIANEAPKDIEAFRLILSPVRHPQFLSVGQDVNNETLVIINDPQSWFYYDAYYTIISC